MHYTWLIIDGYNLMFQDTELESARSVSLESARERLLQQVAAIAPLLAERTTVVFDGTSRGRHAEPASASGIEVLFSPKRYTADTIIERIAHSALQPENICVVTSDNLQRITVMSSGAQTMSCNEFMSHLSDHRTRTASRNNRQRQLRRGPRLGDFFPDA
jgi:predicted RNA-binding protein with PIN domain